MRNLIRKWRLTGNFARFVGRCSALKALTAKIIIAHIFCLALNAFLFGQIRSDLLIRVLDENAGLVSGANMVLSGMGMEFRGVTNDDGVFTVGSLPPGRYILTVNFSGFEKHVSAVEVKPDGNQFDLKLKISALLGSVEVQLPGREKRFDDAITKVFTQEEVEALPDDPIQIERELKRRFGEDAIIDIDWGTGGQIPDKSRIASIKVIKHVFDAEFHTVGNTVVRIRTKAGGSQWTGSLFISHFNSALNSRNSFDLVKLPQAASRAYLSLSPPSIKDDSSVYLSLSVSKRTEVQSYNGITIFPETVLDRIRTNDQFSPSIKFTQNLNNKHVLFASYSYSRLKDTGLGLGALELSERAYRRRSTSSVLSVIESGYFDRFGNDLIFKYSRGGQNSDSEVDDPGYFVLGSISGGGAGIRNSGSSENYEIEDVLSFEYKKNLIKIGGKLEFERIGIRSNDNYNGSFTFSSPFDFEQGMPILFSQRLKTQEISVSQRKLALFVQNYVKLKKFFQIGAGFRYESQNAVKDSNNFAPRIGLVWSPEKTGRLILRAGFGMIYFWLDTSDLAAIKTADAKNSRDLIIRDPQFSSLPENGNIDRAEVSIFNTIEKDPDLKSPELYVAFIKAELKPIEGLELSGHYLFGKGTHQFRSRDSNAPVNGVRPDINLGRKILVESTGNAISHYITLMVRTRVKDISISGSHRIVDSRSDFEDIFALPSNSYNLREDWGPYRGVSTHRSSIDMNFSLFDLTRISKLKSILASFDFTAQSGAPYSILTGKDNNGDAVVNDRPFGVKRNTEREGWSFKSDLNVSWQIPYSKQIATLKNRVRSINLSATINNLFNHTNRRGYVGVQTSPFFGDPTYSDPARNISFGLYVGF